MKKLLHRIRPLLGLTLLIFALFVIHHVLRKYHYHDIVQQLRQIPQASLILCVALTVISYTLLTFYDVLALRYIQYPLAYSKIALASFIGYVFSYNLTVFGGSAARYRIYSSWGLSALDVVKLTIFGGLTLWLGCFALAGVAFIFEPLTLPEFLHIPFASSRPIGAIFIALITVYTLWTGFRRKPVRIHGLEFVLPSLSFTLVQIAIASLDWALAGSVLYVLLPRTASLSYPGFLSIFMLAQFAGLVSQVPGGLGAFEIIALFLLSPIYSAPVVFGALLIYRIIYYLFPFGIAAAVLTTHELMERKGVVRWLRTALGQWAPMVIPHVFAFTVFLGGVILIFSGALPAEKGRLALLRDFLPLPLIEVSHFLASLMGFGLLVLARGLQRRLDAAYHLTIVLLISGVILSLTKGLDYEEAVILTIMLAIILPCHSEFRRKSSFLNEAFTFNWVAGIVIVLISSIWLGMFSYKHIEYSDSLWWQFAFSSDAPRFLRAMAGTLGFAMVFALTMLLRSPSRPFISERVTDIEKVRKTVEISRRTYANLALLGDKNFLLSSSGRSFIMYAASGQSWIAMGDPVGPKQEWDDLIWWFHKNSDRHGCWPVFYGVDGESLHHYTDFGLAFLKIGEEACVPLKTFSIEGSKHRSLRYMCNKFKKTGYGFKVISRNEVAASMAQLKDVSDAWLKQKNVKEKGFSLGFFNEEYLKYLPAAIVRSGGKIVAFANLWCGAENEELSIDLMRYLPDLPDGVMDYLFTQLMLWGRQKGYLWFNLGMAPLSGLDDRAMAKRWNQFGSFVFRHGEHFYNFQGLRKYKEKFKPEWHPKYLVCRGGLVLPRILSNLVSLTSGGLAGVVSK